MRSLFGKILLWFLATMFVLTTALVLTNMFAHSPTAYQQSPYEMLMGLHFRKAREAYENGGSEALRREMVQFQELTKARTMLTDARGRDLMTGAQHPELMEQVARRPNQPVYFEDRMLIARPSADGRYYLFLFVQTARWLFWFVRPQYLWILAVLILLCYGLALHLTSPLRKLQRAVARFGGGDRSARADTRRKDEFGELAVTFNQMAERIETLLAAERRLLLDISHEIRSPLARLSVAIELARSGNEADRQEALNRVQKEADRLNRLLSELLQVTRAEGDSARLRTEPVDLGELVKELVDDSLVETKARSCRLTLEVREQLTVDGDAELLRRAVENVLRNAIRYAPEDTAVEVTVERDGGAAVLRVRDYGPGVPEEAVAKIFDPFYRVDSDRNRSSGGAGLGLAIARRAVELHGGRVTAANRHPGLELRLELPLPAAATIPAGSSVAATTS